MKCSVTVIKIEVLQYKIVDKAECYTGVNTSKIVTLVTKNVGLVTIFEGLVIKFEGSVTIFEGEQVRQ